MSDIATTSNFQIGEKLRREAQAAAAAYARFTVNYPPPDAWLRRSEVAFYLSAAGFTVSQATLATIACRGGGPAFSKFGARPLYKWGDALAWAEAKLSKKISVVRIRAHVIACAMLIPI